MTICLEPTHPYLHRPLMNLLRWSGSRRLSSASLSLQVVCPLQHSWLPLYCASLNRNTCWKDCLFEMSFFRRSPHHWCLLVEGEVLQMMKADERAEGNRNRCFDGVRFAVIQKAESTLDVAGREQKSSDAL